MDNLSEREERLREAASIGDLDTLENLCKTVSINSKNNINGWTALHWGCKRNHVGVVKILLQQGADKNICNNKEETPDQLTNNSEILELLGCPPKPKEEKQSELPITPNYIANPPFPHVKNTPQIEKDQGRQKESFNMNGNHSNSEIRRSNHGNSTENEIVLKARIANMEETDFIEIELDRSTLTFVALVKLLCDELKVDSKLVQKVRKRPDTIVRKDKDVARLKDFQELELVLTNKAQSSLSRTYSSGNYNAIGAAIKKEQILY
ncbi:ankyrin repeat domain-containing protein 40 [Patella vulgata]|uniref:ankyrin repeat domain-containing protein 40 n=1 Tax=Patella vulgata TaxID=6465 RepID=UPI0024A87287|nr:ankyrin repeat domain-containing protein 40 [Patella vulgata]